MPCAKPTQPVSVELRNVRDAGLMHLRTKMCINRLQDDYKYWARVRNESSLIKRRAFRMSHLKPHLLPASLAVSNSASNASSVNLYFEVCFRCLRVVLRRRLLLFASLHICASSARHFETSDLLIRYRSAILVSAMLGQ